jgi:hypothetical protein
MTLLHKITASLLLSGLMVGFTACSGDDDLTGAATTDGQGDECTITFHCLAPADATVTSTDATRSYSDGQTAKWLFYALYSRDADGTLTLLNHDRLDAFNSNARPSQDVDLNVLVGKSYTVVFYATTFSNQPYKVTAANGSCQLTADYTNAKCNDETRDFFYKRFDFTASRQRLQETVVLTRPLAQINYGTHYDEWNRATLMGALPTQTAITINNAYSTLDMLTGEVSGDVSATFSLNDIPLESEVFPLADGGSNYRYVAMAYVLAHPDKKTFTSTLSANTFTASGDEWTLDNVPLQRNHRTNIYGNLLSGTQKLTVALDPGYIDTYDFGPKEQLEALLTVGKGTLDLYGNVELSEPLTVNVADGEVVGIDLDEYAITLNGTGPVFRKTGPGTLLLTGKDGSIICTNQTLVEIAEGEVVIESGTYDAGATVAAEVPLISLTGSGTKLVISGGTFLTPGLTLGSSKAIVATSPATTSGVQITGGTFFNFNPASMVPTGYTVSSAASGVSTFLNYSVAVSK